MICEWAGHRSLIVDYRSVIRENFSDSQYEYRRIPDGNALKNLAAEPDAGLAEHWFAGREYFPGDVLAETFEASRRAANGEFVVAPFEQVHDDRECPRHRPTGTSPRRHRKHQHCRVDAHRREGADCHRNRTVTDVRCDHGDSGSVVTDRRLQRLRIDRVRHGGRFNASRADFRLRQERSS
jgi:hypothetical protein